MGKRSHIFLLLDLLIFCGVVTLLESKYCDENIPGNLQEGNLGQDSAFPWLGVLRVHLHEGETFRIAVTGIVLMKDKFAIANANDIVRIPRDLFKGDSKAMFIPRRDDPWIVPVEDYVTHPEYDYSSVNTIAIVELKIEIDAFIPVKPICWPKYSFNTSNHLYVIGYTDENKLLEKELHKLQFVKEKYCDEFYTRAGLKEDKMQPKHVQCAFSQNAKADCVWESGQVMASNASGYWTVVGLGVHGPGCAAPARFISLTPYLMWIQTVTDLDQISDYRRSAFGTGFMKPNVKAQQRAIEEIPDVPEIPIHETFLRQDTDNDTISDDNAVTADPTTILHPYEIKYEDWDMYKVDRIDDDAINISIFDNTYQSAPDACRAVKTLLYHDETKVVAETIHGSGVYRVRSVTGLTLHDMTVMGYSCVQVRVQALSNERPKLWWRKSIDKYEATRFEDLGYLPKKLLKIIPVNSRMLPTTPSPKWSPGGHMEAQHVVDERDYEGLENINLLIRFTFRNQAILKVKVYGSPYPPLGYTPSPETETTQTTKKSLRNEPNSSESDEDYQPTYKTPANFLIQDEQEIIEDLNLRKNFRKSNRRDKQSSIRPHHSTRLLKVPRKRTRLQKAIQRDVERRFLEKIRNETNKANHRRTMY